MDNISKKYIETEIELAKYRISVFEKQKNLSIAKKRMIEWDKEFISIPFEKLDFKNLDELIEAINLFKTSRSSFYKEYNFLSIDNLLEKYDLKLSYLKNKKKEFLTTRIFEINCVQDPYFYNEFLSNESELTKVSKDVLNKEYSKYTIKDILLKEPIKITRMRARVQAIIYSIGLYLEDEINHLKYPRYESQSILEEIDSLNYILENLKFKIFKYFNKSLSLLPDILKDTTGENNIISKVNYLENIFNSFPGEIDPIVKNSSFDPSHPQIGNLLYGIKPVIYETLNKDKLQKKQNKVIGILFPLERIGNEKMSIWYKKIFYKNTDITNLFCSNFSNVKTCSIKEGVYNKALMMKPLWELLDLKLDSHQEVFLEEIFNYSIKNMYNNMNDNNVAEIINSHNTNYLNISDNESIILVTKTRSDENYLSKAFEIVNDRLDDIYLK